MMSFKTDKNQVEQIEGMSIEFPYCMHQRDLTTFVVPWHWHEELELGYIEKGTSIIRTLSQEYTVHQGDGFFINTNVVDTKINGNPGSNTLEINHIFHPIFIGGHFGSLITQKYLNPILQNANLSVHIIRRGSNEADAILDNLILLKEVNYKENQEIEIRNILSKTWLMLIEEINKHFVKSSRPSPERQSKIKSMLSYIHRNYDKKITLEEISREGFCSTRDANRIFQNSIHQSPFEYLVNYRLEQAKKLLENSTLYITEISYRCGFTDCTYMGKQFKKKYGLTPLEYRRNLDTASK